MASDRLKLSEADIKSFSGGGGGGEKNVNTKKTLYEVSSLQVKTKAVSDNVCAGSEKEKW